MPIQYRRQSGVRLVDYRRVHVRRQRLGSRTARRPLGMRRANRVRPSNHHRRAARRPGASSHRPGHQRVWPGTASVISASASNATQKPVIESNNIGVRPLVSGNANDYKDAHEYTLWVVNDLKRGADSSSWKELGYSMLRCTKLSVIPNDDDNNYTSMRESLMQILGFQNEVMTLNGDH